jgi:PIN domain
MRHVVLDTEVFRRENLSFDSARFQRLADLVQEDEAEVHLTDVVVDEVKHAIIEQVRLGVATLRQEPVRRALNVIAHGAVPKLKELLKDLDEAALVESLLQEFEDLLERLNAGVISTDEVPMKVIRERYFQSTPPFGHRAEKKHEFPDAISAVAIERWASQQTGGVVVVTADKGMAAAVQAMARVEHRTELREVVDLLLRRLDVLEDPDALVKFKRTEIENRVTKDFEELGFYVDGDWGEVTEVTVRSIDLGAVYLAERTGELVKLEFEAEIRYTAELSFDDSAETAYDSETGDTYVFGSTSETVRDTTWIEGEVEIELDVNDLARSEVKSVFLAADDIGVPAPREPDYK